MWAIADLLLQNLIKDLLPGLLFISPPSGGYPAEGVTGEVLCPSHTIQQIEEEKETT